MPVDWHAVMTWTSLNSALLTLQAQVPAPAVPEPTLRPGLDEADITPGVVGFLFTALIDRKSTRLNSSHSGEARMPSSA